MLRGTVYLSTPDGSKFYTRVVMQFEGVYNEEHFKQRARDAWPHCALEYGPITETWGK